MPMCSDGRVRNARPMSWRALFGVSGTLCGLGAANRAVTIGDLLRCRPFATVALGRRFREQVFGHVVDERPKFRRVVLAGWPHRSEHSRVFKVLVENFDKRTRSDLNADREVGPRREGRRSPTQPEAATSSRWTTYTFRASAGSGRRVPATAGFRSPTSTMQGNADDAEFEAGETDCPGIGGVPP
jgi:hypothetical protein